MQKFEHLIVCGDSYQTPSEHPKFLGTHWSEVLSTRMGIPLMTLASPGMSDTGIAFQIMEATKYKNALVVMSMCPGLRFDRNAPNSATMQITHHTNFKLEQVAHNYKNIYIHPTSISTMSMDSVTDRVFLTETNHDLEEFKQLCVIFHALDLLKKQTNDFLFFDSMPNKHKKRVSEVLDEKNIVTTQQLDLQYNCIDHSTTPNWQDIDPGYHTLPDRQVQIADYVENRVWNGVR